MNMQLKHDGPLPVHCSLLR